MARIFFVLLLVMLPAASCVTVPKEDISEYISLYGNKDPSPSYFIFCHNHNCSRSETVSLTTAQWNDAKNVFQPTPENAAEERKRISIAIGVIESIVGKATGTATDKLGSVRGWSFANKFDCVDDAVNTGTYLYMLRKDGLIRYHEVREPARRGFVINGKWPHVAVAIVERETGSIYVVDSWFLDNGYPAYVVSFEEWVAGWKPGIAASEGMSDNAKH